MNPADGQSDGEHLRQQLPSHTPASQGSEPSATEAQREPLRDPPDVVHDGSERSTQLRRHRRHVRYD
jgi:hypothetical protein